MRSELCELIGIRISLRFDPACADARGFDYPNDCRQTEAEQLHWMDKEFHMTKLHRISVLVLLFAVGMITFANVFAQSKSKLSPEQRTKNIERFWEANPDQPRSAKPSKDGRIEIPKKLLGDIDFAFQKRMALSGHGVLFDASGGQVSLKKDEAFELQQEMLDALQKEKPEISKNNAKAFDDVGKLLGEINAELKQAKDLKPIQLFALRHIKLRALSFRLSDSRRNVYRWRGSHLWRHLVINRDIELDLRVVRWKDILDGLVFNIDSDYVQQCRSAGVPIPPTWTPSSTSWGDQGPLQQKMLQAGSNAQVWTWADPAHRGGCVALPRGTGGPGNVAGIICQNADNGNACIWDNISLSTGNILPWATEPLNVNKLQGAPQLASNCTGCHSGNNVFLVSPDDPTWCKLLRGGQPMAGCSAITGPNSHNFTLQVEGVVNQLSGHSRYTPLSGSPARAGWTNNAEDGCGGACHLNGSPVGPPAMPPACGANCN